MLVLRPWPLGLDMDFGYLIRRKWDTPGTFLGFDEPTVGGLGLALVLIISPRILETVGLDAESSR